MRCIETGVEFGVDVEKFQAVSGARGERVMAAHGLKWTWAKGNTAPSNCPLTGLMQHPYGKLAPKIGCSMSHYLLWERCVITDEPILILEHDAVFLRTLPDIDFKGICQINDPLGATPHGLRWHNEMVKRGPGVFQKTKVMSGLQPDGLAGNSAYLIKPFAAASLMATFKRLGVWPNDATMCIQLFPYLQELYPFVTRVEQTISTSST